MVRHESKLLQQSDVDARSDNSDGDRLIGAERLLLDGREDSTMSTKRFWNSGSLICGVETDCPVAVQTSNPLAQPPDASANLAVAIIANPI